jgi:hypothetical protein
MLTRKSTLKTSRFQRQVGEKPATYARGRTASIEGHAPITKNLRSSKNSRVAAKKGSILLVKYEEDATTGEVYMVRSRR